MRIRSSGTIMHSDCALLKSTYHHQHNSPQHKVQQSNLHLDVFGEKASLGVGIPESNLTSRQLFHQRHREPHHICAVVRTHKGHANILPITLLSLTQQNYQGEDVKIAIFVVNTDFESYAESDFMHAAAADANIKAGKKVVTVLDASFHKIPPIQKTFGYDVTDRVLDVLMDEKDCTHFLFTNGDNFYVRSLVDWIKPAMLEGKQLIAWDFLSHHPRKYNLIQVQFIRGHVDLGSVLVDRRAIERNRPHLRFLPEGAGTQSLFARDYFFFQEIYNQVGEESVALIHQVLFVHQ